MKNLTVLLLICMYAFSFAGNGKFDKYEATIKTKTNKTMTGSIELETYCDIDYSVHNSFQSKLRSGIDFPFIVYFRLSAEKSENGEVKEYPNPEGAYSYTMDETAGKLLIDGVEYPAGQRIVHNNYLNYFFMLEEPASYDYIYNEEYSGGAAFVLLSWDEDLRLDELKMEINSRINDILLSNNRQDISKYINEIRKDLVKKKVLIFQYCAAP